MLDLRLYQATTIFDKRWQKNQHNISKKSLIFSANPATHSKMSCFLSRSPALESFTAAFPPCFCWTPCIPGSTFCELRWLFSLVVRMIGHPIRFACCPRWWSSGDWKYWLIFLITWTQLIIKGIKTLKRRKIGGNLWYYFPIVFWSTGCY